MDRDTVWRHVHEQRRALAGLLAGLDAEEWEHESLCPGWTVRDVAAHVISTPQIGLADVLRMTPLMLRGYNRAIFAETKRWGRAPIERILADYERLDGSRRHVPTTTHVEPLLDALVHSQDVARPLGRRLDVHPEAAVVAADRARLLSPVFGTRRLLKGVRMVATDVDWSRGRGPTLEGPAQELLMVCTGRAPYEGSLTGEGVALLPRAT
jgi:uncharacterized protein (TIGR03083 family)